MAVRRRSVSPNVASNSTRKARKFCRNGDEVSTNGANQACAAPDRRVLMRPTWRKSSTYRWGPYSWIISLIWFMNPRKCFLVPLNLSGKLTLGSKLVLGWEGVGESIDEEPCSIGRTFVDVGGELFFSSSSIGVPTWSFRNDSRRLSFSSWNWCVASMRWFILLVRSNMLRLRRWQGEQIVTNGWNEAKY